jgi:hypothetical protein
MVPGVVEQQSEVHHFRIDPDVLLPAMRQDHLGRSQGVVDVREVVIRQRIAVHATSERFEAGIALQEGGIAHSGLDW